MNNKILSNLENSKFGLNKYYKEIIMEFINEYDSSRININDDIISIKVSDKIGSRDITFNIDDLGRLKIKINRNFDMMRIQDIIVYDDHGVMLERTNCQAELKHDVNDKFKDNKKALEEEFNELGFPSIYTGQIFKSINLKKIKRPENYGIDGTYIHKVIEYDERGLMNGKNLEGTVNILNSNSISSLEFPNDSDVAITKEEILDDNNTYEYPNSRSL